MRVGGDNKTVKKNLDNNNTNNKEKQKCSEQKNSTHITISDRGASSISNSDTKNNTIIRTNAQTHTLTNANSISSSSHSFSQQQSSLAEMLLFAFLQRHEQLHILRSRTQLLFSCTECALLPFFPTYRMLPRPHCEDMHTHMHTTIINTNDDNTGNSNNDERDTNGLLVYSNKKDQTPSFTDRIFFYSPNGASADNSMHKFNLNHVSNVNKNNISDACADYSLLPFILPSSSLRLFSSSSPSLSFLHNNSNQKIHNDPHPVDTFSTNDFFHRIVSEYQEMSYRAYPSQCTESDHTPLSLSLLLGVDAPLLSSPLFCRIPSSVQTDARTHHTLEENKTNKRENIREWS